jgi:hypothetical protein
VELILNQMKKDEEYKKCKNCIHFKSDDDKIGECLSNFPQTPTFTIAEYRCGEFLI